MIEEKNNKQTNKLFKAQILIVLMTDRWIYRLIDYFKATLLFSISETPDVNTI